MTHDTPEPSGWIRRHAALLAPVARVLDLAAGRNVDSRRLPVELMVRGST